MYPRIRVKYQMAFTLIELLIVIAIITILAAVLFPVFATAREKARQSTCATNLKEIGLGVTQYVQDFDEMMPYSVYKGNCTAAQTPDVGCIPGFPSIAGYTGYHWTTTVAPYIAKEISVNGARSFTSQSIYICPDFPNKVGADSALMDYLMNPFCGSGSTCTTGIMAINMPGNIVESSMSVSKVSRVTDIALASEAWAIPNYCNNLTGKICPYTDMLTLSIPPTNSTYFPVGSFNVHSGGANVLLFDGHVKWFNDIQIRANANANDMWAQSSL